MIGLDHRMRVVHYELTDHRIENPICIVLLTDLHSCSYGKSQETIVNAIEREKPDVVLLGGDIVDDKLPEEKAWELLSRLGEYCPTYYVTGNHEWWIEDTHRVIRQMEQYHITVLAGEKRELEFHGGRVDLFGVDDPEVGRERWQSQMEKLKKEINPEVFSIILSHRPERYSEYLDFSLSLSGHAHGGQWRIPYLLNGLLAPNQGFFPQYAGGLYEFEDHRLIVSRGLARESTRIPRFYNRPELVVIHLLPTEE